MFRQLGIRLGSAAITALLSTLAVFVLIRAVPGDIVAQMLGQSAGDPDAERALRQFFGLDQPLAMQYGDWLSHSLRGDFGISWRLGRPVFDLVMQAFLVTLPLGLITLLIACATGIPMGVTAAVRKGRLAGFITAVESVGLSAPVFWTGLLLLIAGATWFEWSPPLDYANPWESPLSFVQSMLLPVLSLALLQAAAISRFTREAVQGELARPYVQAARARGLRPPRVHFNHVMRNVAIGLSSFLGVILLQVLGGAVVIETLFSLPGLGRLLFSSLQARDYPVVQGALLMVVVIAMLINAIVDLFYVVIDPRLRQLS